MLSPSDILFGVLLPFVVSALILVLARMVAKARHWSGPLAIGIAFTVAFACIEGRSHLFPPSSAIPWLFYLGLLFSLVGLLDASFRMPLWLRAIIIFLATLLGAGLMFRFNFTNHTWTPQQGTGWLSLIAIIAVIWWSCFEFIATEHSLIMPMAAMFITGIAGLVVMLVADQTIGQALGALALSLAAAAIVIAWFKDISLSRGTSMIIAGVGICAFAGAYFLSDVPILDLSLVAMSPLVLVASRYLPMPKAPSRLITPIRIAFMLIPLLIALVLAIAQFRREAAEKSADPYSALPPANSGSIT